MSKVSSPAHCRSASLSISVALFALDKSDEHFTGSVEAFSEQNIQLRVKSALGSGRRLVMNYEGRRTELEVVSCRKGETGVYCLDCKITSLGEGAIRNDWRMPVDWPAEVEIPPGKDRHKAQVRDVSVFGLGIELRFQPALDSLLTITMKNGIGFGRVKHYRSIARNRYFVGVYLEEFISNEQRFTHNGSPEGSFSRNLGRLLLKAAQSVTGAIIRRNRT